MSRWYFRYFCVQPSCSSFCFGASLERQPDPLGAMTWRLQDQLGVKKTYALPANIAPENRPSQKETHLPTSNHQFSGAMWLSGRVIHHQNNSALPFQDNYTCNTYSQVELQVSNALHPLSLYCPAGWVVPLWRKRARGGLACRKKPSGAINVGWWSGLVFALLPDLVPNDQRYFMQISARNSFFPNCWMAIS